MIQSFKSKALKRYFERNDASKLDARDVRRVRAVLTALEAASSPGELALPGFHFHSLKGDRAGQYAVTVRANWRITFEWDGEDAIRVNLEDYHD